METNMLIMTSPSSDTRQGRSEKRAIPRKRVSSSVGLSGAFGSMAGIWGTNTLPYLNTFESHAYQGHISLGLHSSPPVSVLSTSLSSTSPSYSISLQ